MMRKVLRQQRRSPFFLETIIVVFSEIKRDHYTRIIIRYAFYLGGIMRRYIFVFLIILLAEFIGCAGTGKRGARRDRYLITTDEIATVPQADTAWDVIKLLRPGLLERDTRRHVGMSAGMPSLVFVDGMRIGYKTRLQSIAAINILEIRYIDGIEAGTRYGTDAAGGIFFVTTIR